MSSRWQPTWLAIALLLVAARVGAQPTTPTTPLGQIRDDNQLAATVTTITQDPAVHVDDQARSLARALLIEGVRQLRAQAYDQALANFLEAYHQLPSPKILLDIALTLREMGRLADAANTYQRYLGDPAADRVVEVRRQLAALDAELATLTIRVAPRGAELSIDGGPFVAVGSALSTRVRPGVHLIRIQHGQATSEITVTGFEGDAKTVELAVDPDGASPPTEVPDQLDGWLITGTRYTADSATGRVRHVRSGAVELAPLVPSHEVTIAPTEVALEEPVERPIHSGVLAAMRFDGKGRGAAVGVGIAYTPRDELDIELAGLRSAVWGAYLGVRYRFLTGWLRPYAAAGLPIFFFTDDANMARTAVGARVAGGIELVVGHHLSVVVDLGIEHFFNVGDTIFAHQRLDETVFVPTLGVIGRL